MKEVVKTWLLLAALALAAPAFADEYPAAWLDGHARYVKEVRQTDLSFIRRQSGPGVHVKRFRRKHWTEWRYERDRWVVAVRVPIPPDDLASGHKVVIPLQMRIEHEGADALSFTATVTARGIAPGRVESIPGTIVKSEKRSERAVAHDGQITFTPRLDWDAPTIGIEIAFKDAAGTEYVLGRYAWWSNRLRQVDRQVPRRRDLDPPPP